MLIVMRHGATEEEVRRVVAVIQEMGYQSRPMPGAPRVAVGGRRSVVQAGETARDDEAGEQFGIGRL